MGGVITFGTIGSFLQRCYTDILHISLAKITVLMLIALDLPTFYLNSVFSQAVYVEGAPVGVAYSTNFFSSYVNPLGLVLTEKWQWLVYLAIRAALAGALIALMLWLSSLKKASRKKTGRV